MDTITMLFAKDVEATSKWYQEFLGMKSGHGGPEFEMLLHGDKILLQLHEIEADHDHGVVTSAPLGHGVVVFVYVDDAEAAFARAKAHGIEIANDLEYNRQAHMWEFTVRDPNGYAISVCKSDWAG